LARAYPCAHEKYADLQDLLCGTIFMQIARRFAGRAAARASACGLAAEAAVLAPLGDEVGGIDVSVS
jgi:hypothetical protein